MRRRGGRTRLAERLAVAVDGHRRRRAPLGRRRVRARRERRGPALHLPARCRRHLPERLGLRPATHQCVPRSGDVHPGRRERVRRRACGATRRRCGAARRGRDAGWTPRATRTARRPRVRDSAPGSPDVTVADARERDAPTGDGPDGNVARRDPRCAGRAAESPAAAAVRPIATAASARTRSRRRPRSTTVMGMSFCTQPCCTSADCPPHTVCFATGGGGNYCVSPKWIGRSGGLGTGLGGATCTGDADCRSGLCNMTARAPTRAARPRRRATECASGTVCRFAAFPGSGFDTHETAWCGASIGNVGRRRHLRRRQHLPEREVRASRQCEAVCRNSSDCGGGLACSYGAARRRCRRTKTSSPVASPPRGTRRTAATAPRNADCQSAFCDGAHCTDVCVTDADCKSGMHCRPVVVQVQGSYSVLACES